MARAELRHLFAPRSIAVIGASDGEENTGGVAVRLLRKFGYPGTVFPVHPSAPSVDGLACFASLAQLPETPELAIIALGADRVDAALADCIAAGVPAGIVWAGGFAEIGPEGRRRQDAIERRCDAAGFTLLGPNCLGVISSALPLTATFASFLVETDELLAGSIAMVGQSGGLVTMALATAQRHGVGFRHAVSTGNEAGVGVGEVIEAFAADPGTAVIACYLEGTADGEALLGALAVAREADKPVIVLRGGDSEASAAAAAAHTGALAGAGRVWHAVLAEEGAIQVGSLEELLDVALVLDGAHGGGLPSGNRMAVVTFGGGSGVLSADQCAREGLVTPALSALSRARLGELAPATASLRNPVDLTPPAYSNAHHRAQLGEILDTIAADPNIDAILVQFGPMALGGAEVADALARFVGRCPKTVLVAWPLAPSGALPVLAGEKIVVFEEYARAVRVAARLVERQASLATIPREAPPSAPTVPWEWFSPEPVPGEVLGEHVVHRLFKEVGITTASGHLATSIEVATASANAIGFPVALKVASSTVTHRAQSGLVRLGIENEEQVRRAYIELQARSRAMGIVPEGIYVEAMVRDGIELLCSGFRDPTFGPMLSVGAGGVFTELIDDVVLGRAPVGIEGAIERLRRVGVVRRVLAVDPKRDLLEVGALVSRFSAVAAAAPFERFVLEINPLKWSAHQTVAVDGLLIVERP